MACMGLNPSFLKIRTLSTVYLRRSLDQWSPDYKFLTISSWRGGYPWVSDLVPWHTVNCKSKKNPVRRF